MLKDEKDFERSHHALQPVLAEDRNDKLVQYTVYGMGCRGHQVGLLSN